MKNTARIAAAILTTAFAMSAHAATVTQRFATQDVGAGGALDIKLDTSKKSLQATSLTKIAEGYYQVDSTTQFSGPNRVGSTPGRYAFMTGSADETIYVEYSVTEQASMCNDADGNDTQLQIWATSLVIKNDGSEVESQLRAAWLTEKSECDQKAVRASSTALRQFAKNPQAFIMSMAPAAADSQQYAPLNKPIVEVPHK